MRILVTGGAGFIGSHLIDRLIERGEQIVCLDAFADNYSPAIKWANIDRHVSSKAFELVEGDIRDAKLVTDLFAKFRPEKVAHLAARVAVGPSVRAPLDYEDVNCRGTINLLETCVKNDVGQFVFASSSSVYGNNRKLPFSEDDKVAGAISPYAATKAAGELLCHTWHHLYGLPMTLFRFFTVYGPRQRPEMAIHKFTRRIDLGETIEKYGDGSSRRDYTFYADIIQGLLAGIDNVFDYEIINLGESRTISLNELIAAIETVIGKTAVIGERPEQPGDVNETYADISKARKLLGYNPQFPIERGLEEFWKWYQKNREILLSGGPAGH